MGGCVLEGKRFFRAPIEIATARRIRPGCEFINRPGKIRPQDLKVIRNLSLELSVPNQREDRLLHRMHVVREAYRIDDDRPEPLQHCQGFIEDAEGLRVLTQEIAANADAGPVERTDLEKLGVVGLEEAGALFRDLIRRINSGHDAQDKRYIMNAPGHRTHGIKAQRKRHEAAAAEQAERRAEAYNAVSRGRVANGAARIAAQAELRECSRDTCSRTAAGTGRVTHKVVWIAGLAAYRTEALGNGAGLDNSRVRCTGHTATAGSEFAQIVLGEKNGTGVLKFLNDKRVRKWKRAREQARTCGRG